MKLFHKLLLFLEIASLSHLGCFFKLIWNPPAVDTARETTTEERETGVDEGEVGADQGKGL